MAGGIFGIGGRGDRYGSFTKTDAYNPDAYQYGGYQGGARDEKANLNFRRGLVEERAAPTLYRGEGTQTRAAQYAGLGRLDAASAGQTQDMRLLEDAATGNAPSKAEILGRQMSDRALRSQACRCPSTCWRRSRRPPSGPQWTSCVSGLRRDRRSNRLNLLKTPFGEVRVAIESQPLTLVDALALQW